MDGQTGECSASSDIGPAQDATGSETSTNPPRAGDEPHESDTEFKDTVEQLTDLDLTEVNA